MQAIVEGAGQFRPAELRQHRARQLGPLQKAAVGGVPHRVQAAVHPQGQAQAPHCVGHSFPAGAGSEGHQVLGQGGRFVQGLHNQIPDRAPAPLAGFFQMPVIVPHFPKLGKDGGKLVGTGLHTDSFLRIPRKQKSRPSERKAGICLIDLAGNKKSATCPWANDTLLR